MGLLSKGECKRILDDLKAKASVFRWSREKENFGIIARKIAQKEQLREKEYFICNLNDFKSLRA